MQVSVCLIVKNEELHIERALQSIPMLFEIVVVDTGSEDSTIDLVNKYNVKLSHFHWNNDFSAARNYANSLASGDYILIMDADEELSEDIEEQIYQFVNKYPSTAGSVIIENIIDNEIRRHRMVRFFPNHRSYQFNGLVHEKLFQFDKAADFESTDMVIRHFGYQTETYKNKDKVNRYLPLYQKHLSRYPNDGYMLYQMGKLYYSISDYSNAELFFRKSWLQKEESNLYFPVMLVMWGYCMKEMGRSAKAQQMLLEYLDIYTDIPDLPFLLGLLAMDVGSIQIIEPCFLTAISIGDTTKYSSINGVGTYKAAYNLAVYYEIIGNKPSAIQYYQLALSYGYEEAGVRLKLLI
ncbi:glycosyltransferase [Paenibacillus sp. NPDC056579]|uniref:glycosyltransferase n=1 Tax=Paenibacillus sp. NPDC056579 TaxID=3345871 RepID=UPI0036B0DA5D